MRPAATVRVQWTRAELLALREAIEVTPNFEGRQDVRDTFRHAVRAPRIGVVELEHDLAERLGNRLVPVDLATATARAKLLRAVRGPRKRTVAQVHRPQPVLTGVSTAAAA
ncbi:hypothetical protein [Gaiella sp.]|jgi:hypothetical protein|uniref:hypothetical protein n=1 Tax=Gaiella sp. TaxID=2663207 RepID=UPI002C6EF810|nr:hypothetical protein [Gaiella sp.]HWO81863.1 hypothetical protein [Gaiella sp.]